MRQRFIGLLLALVLLSVFGLQPAAAQNGNWWQVDYYPNMEWRGPAVYTQYANFADFTWGTAAPGPNMPAQNYTARLTTDAFFYAGYYRFNVLADDEVRISVNNVTFFDTVDRGQSGKAFSVDIPFAQGPSRVVIDFRQFTGPAYLHVSWGYVKPGPSYPSYPPPSAPAPLPTVPPPTIVPPPSSAPTLSNKYGDFTPCIQQNIHQANCFRASGEWNSPNLGSIQMEPQIVIWQPCKADEQKVQRLFANKDPQASKCSKSEAGWFPQ